MDPGEQENFNKIVNQIIVVPMNSGKRFSSFFLNLYSNGIVSKNYKIRLRVWKIEDDKIKVWWRIFKSILQLSKGLTWVLRKV